MKHWRETREIVGRVLDLAAAGRSAALATVVAIAGSAYRRPGAKFLVDDNGRTCGGLSGGCLETDVQEIARQVMTSNTPRLLHYDTGTDDRTVWGLGLGCNGSVDIFVQSATEPSTLDTLRAVRARLDHGHTFAVSTVVAGNGTGRSIVVGPGEGWPDAAGPSHVDRELARRAAATIHDGHSSLDRVGGLRVFTDVLEAPPTLVVCGAGDDARPLVAYAAEAGFSVVVVDHRRAFLSPDRFPAASRLVEAGPDADSEAVRVDACTLVVVKMHAFGHDRDWLRRFLRTPASYIGLLGPRARAAQILRQAEAEHDPRVFGPVGLDVGADGPEQIAISIVAELLAVRTRQHPGHLREREAAIHV